MKLFNQVKIVDGIKEFEHIIETVEVLANQCSVDGDFQLIERVDVVVKVIEDFVLLIGSIFLVLIPIEIDIKQVIEIVAIESSK